MDKIEKWADLLGEEERLAYSKAGFGRPIGLGARPALLNVDTTFMFVDPSYALCGSHDQVLLDNVALLTETFRALDLPIYYSRRDDRAHPTSRGVWNYKLGSADSFQYQQDAKADEWPPAYAPRQQDRVVLKNKPSCFFDSPLQSWLRYDGVDSLVVMGTTTSGCVRAAVVDAFSNNFRTLVAEDACADRSHLSHRANLFDMDMKYADVEPTETIVATLRGSK